MVAREGSEGDAEEERGGHFNGDGDGDGCDRQL